MTTNTSAVSTLLQLIGMLKDENRNAPNYSHVVSNTLAYLRPYMDSIVKANQTKMNQGKWYDAKAQLNTFLSLHNSTNLVLSNIDKSNIKSFMVSVLVKIHEELDLDSKQTMCPIQLQARFKGKEAFAKIQTNNQDWKTLSSMYAKIATMNFFVTECNKQMMETAAVLLVQGRLKCVSGGKPSLFIVRLHFVYHTATKTMVVERNVPEERKSEHGEKYQGYLEGVRCKRGDLVRGAHSSCDMGLPKKEGRVAVTGEGGKFMGDGERDDEPSVRAQMSCHRASTSQRDGRRFDEGRRRGGSFDVRDPRTLVVERGRSSLARNLLRLVAEGGAGRASHLDPERSRAVRVQGRGRRPQVVRRIERLGEHGPGRPGVQ
ncbi:hypothetical protein EON65_47575 [archaeon]|nr:MAG: hypothetical protein EON65_47575 [archaeon]